MQVFYALGFSFSFFKQAHMLWRANSFLFLDMDSGYLILIRPNPHLPLQSSYP